MRVLVCVKRVPAPGAKIVLAEDGQSIDTGLLSFTVSPHEECAVEEGVRIAEAHDGSVTVLTLGPPEAEEQLRSALAVGANAAVLISTDGSDWDPISTATAISDAVEELESEGPFDLILFGNESADSGGYQVGIRVAHALGRPIVTGIKGIEVGGGTLTLRRETPAGSELYELPVPAVVAVKEGINLPRYPTLKGRLSAKKVEVSRLDRERVGSGQEMVRLTTPEVEVSETEILGTGAEAAPALVEVIRELPGGRMMILTLITHDRGALEETTLQGLTFARGLAEDLGIELHAVVVGADVEELSAFGVEVTHRVVHDELDDYSPAAWGACIGQLVQALQPIAVVSTGTDRGNEVMAHVGAITSLPMVANCREVDVSEDVWSITRTRWGGSLLEETRLDAPTKLLTVTEHSVEAVEAGQASEMKTEVFTPDLSEADLVTKVRDRVTVAEGVTLATAPLVVSGGRGVGSAEGFEQLEELARLLGGVVGCSRVVTNNGWRPHSDQVGQTGTVVAPDIYIACGISGAIQHWVGMMASKTIIAINTDAEAPMVTKADYAVIGDLHEIVPALVEELKQRQA